MDAAQVARLERTVSRDARFDRECRRVPIAQPRAVVAGSIAGLRADRGNVQVRVDEALHNVAQLWRDKVGHEADRLGGAILDKRGHCQQVRTVLLEHRMHIRVCQVVVVCDGEAAEHAGYQWNSTLLSGAQPDAISARSASSSVTVPLPSSSAPGARQNGR